MPNITALTTVAPASSAGMLPLRHLTTSHNATNVTTLRIEWPSGIVQDRLGIALAPQHQVGADGHRHLEALKAFLVGHNVELEYQPLARGLLGYTDGRRITCGTGQASHVEFATLAHETTHVLLHFPADRTTRPDLTTRETEAEAVTYLLCAQLGIAGTEASVEYIQSYRGTPDTLDASLERIRATAQRLSTELDAIRFDVEPDPGPA